MFEFQESQLIYLSVSQIFKKSKAEALAEAEEEAHFFAHQNELKIH